MPFFDGASNLARMQAFPRLEPGKPALILAPMEGITDAPMRAVQTEAGAFAFCVSEFLRVCHQSVPEHVFLRHVPELKQGCRTPSRVPVQIQLLGGQADALAEAAQTAVRLGVGAIDLNFGCPAPTVNRHDGGATLLKYPHRIREIVSKVRAAVPSEIPVSAKLRLGWDSIDSILENAEMAAQGGATWLTIHGRTRVAGYQPPIFWEPIGEVRKRLAPLPVVANGDIWTMEDFRRCREITQCEHFMLGRGALVDPLLPMNAAAELGIGDFKLSSPFGIEPLDWLPLFQRFGTHIGARSDRSQLLARRIKQWTSMATRYGKVPWFDGIKRLPTAEAIFEQMASRG